MATAAATVREAGNAAGAGWIGARLEDLDTPAPVIDLDIMEGNIARMQAACDALGLRFRPHIKTHKIPAIAALQRAAGAHGLTAQKTTEAQVFAAAGFDDLLIAVPPVGRHKVARLCDLAERVAVATAVDSVAAARMIAETAAERGVNVGVFAELDSGMGRAGVQTGEDAAALARTITELPGVTFAGLFFYPSRDEVAGRLAAAREALDRAGIAVPVVSGGGSQAQERSAALGATEHRAGTYLFNDASYVRKGIATLDQCALSVAVTVVSAAVPGVVTVDGGLKTFTNDFLSPPGEGIGIVLDRPGLKLVRMSEEHGVIAVADGSPRPRVGEMLRVVPNHACGCVNMHPALFGMRNGAVEVVWPVAARGTLQ